MSIFNSLFGNATTDSTTTQNLRPAAENLTGQLFDKTNAIANQPYQPYGGGRVAGMGAGQQEGAGRIRNIADQNANTYFRLADQMNVDESRNMRGDARNLAQGISGIVGGSNALLPNQSQAAARSAGFGDLISNRAKDTSARTLGLAELFPDADIAGYMNPYVQQVLDPALEDIYRRAEVQRNELNSRSAMTGSFGGSRNALAQAEQERNVMGEAGRLSANERARAFNEAATQFRLDQTTLPKLYESSLAQLGTGQQAQRNAIDATNAALAGRSAVQQQGLAGQQGIANVANLEQQRYNQLGQQIGLNQSRIATDANALMQVGALERDINQQNLDTAYRDFIEQRDWNQRGIGALINTLGVGNGVNTSGSTTTARGQQGNALGQVVGAGTAAVGALGGLNNIWKGASNFLGGFGGNAAAAGGDNIYNAAADAGGYLFARGGLVNV